jgi:para-aminobenzoate synthetase/4-amino-4-deoxychorismate lyase
VSAPPPPDPRRGVFETLLLAEGRPVELEAHFARLAASVGDVFGAELPDTAAEEVRRAARGISLGRLRIDVEPGDAPGELVHRAVAAPIDPRIFFPPPERGAILRSVRAQGWSGEHKWADRRWLERTEAELGEEVPLLVDEEGRVLEAGRANLFVVAGRELATPPLDGRILAGTARAATLALARGLGIAVAERPLKLAELHDADGVFLTSSVRGVRPARCLDGVELRSGGELKRLAKALRERWLGPAAAS